MVSLYRNRTVIKTLLVRVQLQNHILGLLSRYMGVMRHEEYSVVKAINKTKCLNTLHQLNPRKAFTPRTLSFIFPKNTEPWISHYQFLFGTKYSIVIKLNTLNLHVFT